MNQDDVNGRVCFDIRAGYGQRKIITKQKRKLVKWIIVEDHRLLRP